MPSAGSSSSVKDSPSRRKRLLGSLRTMGSLRSLRPTQNHTKGSENVPDDSKAKPDSPHTPVRITPSLSLDFEVSPPGQAMFTMRNMSSSPSVIVQRSSPITVPTSASQPAPAFNTPPGLSDFTVGTVPKSPAPLQRAAVQETILNYAAQAVPHADSPNSMGRFADPHPTPMPGTNLPLEDVAAPEIIISSASAASMPHYDLHTDKNQDYFSTATSVRPFDDNFVTTDELDPVNDARILAVLVTRRESPPPYTSEASSGGLDPMHSDEATPLRPDDVFALDCPSRESSDLEVTGDAHVWTVWDDPAFANVDKCSRGRGSSTWSRQQASDASTSNRTQIRTEATSLAIPDEDLSNDKSVDRTNEPFEVSTRSTRSESHVPADDRETLQDIIRAYAGPMMYHEEAEAYHACEHSDDFAISQAVPLDEVTSATVKAEVEDSIRVMNRSLGG